jgi:hypothetical protein
MSCPLDRWDTDRQAANYHIFVDSTGFAYDVALTKIEFESNRNERYSITVSHKWGTKHAFAIPET